MSPPQTPPEELAWLLDNTPDGLIVVDASGIVRWANPAAGGLYQRSADRLIGEPFGLPHLAGVQDVDLVLPDGHLRTVELRSVPTTWAGEDVSVIALRDATEQRRREAELGAALVDSGDLTAELAHELSTPLAVVGMFADTLDARWDDLGDDTRRDLIRRIGRQSRRLQQILHRLLLTRHADTETVVEPVALWEVALAHLPDLGIPSVEVDCPPDLRVLADPAHVDEIVVNLVENADKYGAPPITVRARRRGDRVELAVCDQGPGVPESFVPRLFDRYARAEDTRHGPGLGLGLDLVARLAHESGGEVRYEPNHPQGACFVVTFPAA